MAGAADGVAGHHAGAPESASQVEAVVRLVVQATTARRPLRRMHDLYEVLVGGPPVLGWADAVTDAIAATMTSREAVAQVGRWLVRTSTDREPAKFGVVLCGLAGAGTDKEVLQIGGHEEFTLFAAVAIRRSAEDPDPLLLDLARRVHGWGRVHLVERLAESRRLDVRDWLLRGGYRNSILDEYVAYLVAERCFLRQALEATRVDDELLDGAGGLIVALLRGGPAEDIDDYADGAGTVTAYLGHVRIRPLTLERLVVVAELRRWLAGAGADWDDRSRRGWTATVREALEGATDDVLQRREVGTILEHGLGSPDAELFASADHLAKLLGVDTFNRHLAVLERDPLHQRSWYRAVQQADAPRLVQLIALAESRLPLADVATGPADHLGLGPGFEPHGCLDAILQGLGPHPGCGWALVRTALASPVVRNRNMALRVLDQWGASRWPAAARQHLERAAAIEPNESAASRMHQLLDRGTLSSP